MLDNFIKRQQMKLTNGSINRRQFMTTVIATGVTVPVAMGMASQAMAAAPKRGGLFRYGVGHGSTTDTMDSANSENHFTLAHGYCFGNHLTEVDNDGTLVPELAESFESDDAKRWVFDLRKGVEFHNGKTMTSEDVIASFNHHMGEESTSAAKGLLTAVETLTADGPNRVIFQLKEPNADFPFIVSDYHISIRPAGDMASGIGTGGYIVEKFEPGVRSKLKRNPNYFKEGRAHFDEVEMLSIIDVTARQNAMMNGDVDLIDRVDPKTVNLLGRSPNLDILEVTGTLHYTFPMRLDTAPFDNYDLRMALKLSIKRQELVDKILLGHGAVGNDHPISTANRYHAADLAQRDFDPDKAAFHYKKSGHSGAVPLSAADAAFAGAVDAAQLMANSAAEAGINIEVIREPNDGYWSNVWNKKGWSACYWGGRPTEDWMFSAAYTDDTEWNDTAWKTTEGAVKFNKLVKEARGELDDNKRRDIYAECQTLIHDDGGTICPMFANYIMAHGKSLTHDDNVAANWDTDGAKAAERWWFA
ncbi:ABC transporter substrate-binding protein [Alphaproteobacteria bacterium]|jgi:peptide/nickel transport system substrate-binding protein|nr:ABC transporter substrate-binding protein [Alphaproteobacteria bacterium]